MMTLGAAAIERRSEMAIGEIDMQLLKIAKSEEFISFQRDIYEQQHAAISLTGQLARVSNHQLRT